MVNKIFILTSIFFSQIFFSQKNEPIYYDKDWKVTTKDEALYYRVTPIKELGEMILIQDFYINGTPQFEGYAFKNDENKYVGDIIWYDENGNDTTFRHYPNNTNQSTLTYYYPNGKTRKIIQYKKGLKDIETIYHQDGMILMKGVFEKGKPFSGDFDNIKNINNYEDVEDEEVATTTSVLAPPPPKIQETKGVEIRNNTDYKPKGKKIAVTEKVSIF
jgi:antitoxin component YwqK of YwqJK toxin-antitoxin module